MLADHLLCVIDGARTTELAQVGSDISRAYANGALSEDDHQRLWEAIQERRAETRPKVRAAPSSAPQRPVRPRRAAPRSPDRAASRQRRRDVGQERWLPPTIASQLTQGEIAVLSVMVREIVHHGVCDLVNDRIAGLAGVCPTLVKNTRRLAEGHGWINVIHRPVRGQKSKTNLIYALSPELRAWIATRRKMIGGKRLPTTKSDVERKKSSGIRLHHDRCEVVPRKKKVA
jgi:hypothetical protein